MGKLPSQEYIPQTEVCRVSLGSSNPNENVKNLHLCLTGNLEDTVAVARTWTVAASSFLSLCPRPSRRDLPRRGRLPGAALWPRPARSGVKLALSSGRGRLLSRKSPSPRGARHSPMPVSLRPGVRAETNPVDGGSQADAGAPPCPKARG